MGSNSLGKKKQALITKNNIARAFANLVEKNNYNDITIYHILDEAKVSRRTFYRHFTGKEDVMNYCLTMLVMEYYGERDKFFYATRSEEVFAVTLRFMYDRRRFLRSLILSGQFDKFSSQFNENSTEIYNTFGLPWNLSDELENREVSYVSKILIGAYMNVIRYWLVEEQPDAPELVAKDFAMLFNAIPSYFANFNQKKQEEALKNLKRSLPESRDNYLLDENE